MTREKIVQAAIRFEGTLYVGPTHFAAMKAVVEDHTMSSEKRDKILLYAEDGFVTSFGRFVGREEAYQLAKDNQQIVGRFNDAEFARDFSGHPQPRLDSGWVQENYASVGFSDIEPLYERSHTASLEERAQLEEQINVLFKLMALRSPNLTQRIDSVLS